MCREGAQSLLAKRLKVRSTLKQEGHGWVRREERRGEGRGGHGKAEEGQGQEAPFFLSH